MLIIFWLTGYKSVWKISATFECIADTNYITNDCLKLIQILVELILNVIIL